MFGAWEVGFWKVLRTRFQPDLIVGASAGAWNGWAIAGGCTPEELVAEWTDPGTGALLRPLWRPRPELLLERAAAMFARYRPRIPFGLTVVEVPRLRPELVSGDAITARHLAATAAIPVMFPPVAIDGKRYVDGGLVGALPLWAAERMGATRAIALNVLTALPFRALRKLIRPPRTTSALEVTLMEPSARLGALRDAATWSAANVARWVEQGEQDAERLLPSIRLQ
jgi:NTE family protein